jgi:DNA-binding IscR family transcriptional regulator
MSGGGYVTSEEIREEQERHLADLQALRSLMVNGARGPNGGYRLAYLRRRYPTEYAHLRDIEISNN